jgi:hypothetical protein
LVTCDQGYWSRAIASNPSTTARAYFLGGVAWFSIPFACGTTLGLTARALGTLPDFPVLSSFDVGAGLASVRAVTYLMGTTGSVLMLLLIFLSVTSVRPTLDYLCYRFLFMMPMAIGVKRGTDRDVDSSILRRLSTLLQP